MATGKMQGPSKILLKNLFSIFSNKILCKVCFCIQRHLCTFTKKIILLNFQLFKNKILAFLPFFIHRSEFTFPNSLLKSVLYSWPFHNSFLIF